MANVLVMYHSIFEESLYSYLIIFSVFVQKYHIEVLEPKPAIYLYTYMIILDCGTGNMHHV